MILLWSCMAAAALCMVLAGAQAVRLLTACSQSVTLAELRLAAEQAEHQRAEQQIAAQKILLGQAGAWMRAHRPEPTK